MNETTKENDKMTEVHPMTQLGYDILTNFVESGYSSWYTNLEYNRLPEDQDLFISDLNLEAANDDGTPVVNENGTRVVYVITPITIRAAMKKITNGEVGMNSDLIKRIAEAYLEKEYANLDAETDDAIIQVVCFGKLVYG